MPSLSRCVRCHTHGQGRVTPSPPIGLRSGAYPHTPDTTHHARPSLSNLFSREHAERELRDELDGNMDLLVEDRQPLCQALGTPRHHRCARRLATPRLHQQRPHGRSQNAPVRPLDRTQKTLQSPRRVRSPRQPERPGPCHTHRQTPPGVLEFTGYPGAPESSRGAHVASFPARRHNPVREAELRETAHRETRAPREDPRR